MPAIGPDKYSSKLTPQKAARGRNLSVQATLPLAIRHDLGLTDEDVLKGAHVVWTKTRKGWLMQASAA